MAKQIILEYEDREYTLEFTRKSVEKMEQQGFRINSLEDTPMTSLPLLFAGAFLAHHPFAKKDVISKIFDQSPDKRELLGDLAEMFAEPYEALLDDSEDSGKKVRREKNW